MCDKITIKAFLSNTKENEKANKGLPRFDRFILLKAYAYILDI